MVLGTTASKAHSAESDDFYKGRINTLEAWICHIFKEPIKEDERKLLLAD